VFFIPPEKENHHKDNERIFAQTLSVFFRQQSLRELDVNILLLDPDRAMPRPLRTGALIAWFYAEVPKTPLWRVPGCLRRVVR
jgi:hypothetical protein